MILDSHGRELVNIRRTKDDHYPETARVPLIQRTQAGVLMTPDRAVTISAVWRAISYLAQTVAKLPWRLKREDPATGDVKIQWQHTVDWMLNNYVAPPEWSSRQFRETLLHWALRWGNGYAEIERDLAGRPLAMWPIHPSRVDVVRDLETEELYYRISANRGGLVDLHWRDVFHLRGFGEGPVGVNVLAYAAQSLGWAKAAQLFGANFFGSGAQLSGVVKVKKPLSPEALAELRKDWRQSYGSTRSGDIAVLDAEMDYTSIGVEPEKGQFIETNQFLIAEVCRWIGVPPHKVYELSRATWNNVEQLSIEVVADSIEPWAGRFEDEANLKLLGENRRNLYTDIELVSLLRADTATRLAYYQGMRNIAALNSNEIRRAEGFNSIGEQGEAYTLPVNIQPLEKALAEPPESNELDESSAAGEPSPLERLERAASEPEPDESEPDELDEPVNLERLAFIDWAIRRGAASMKDFANV